MQPRPAESVSHQIVSVGYRPRFLLIVALAVSAGAFVFASRTFHVPAAAGHFDASLLAQRSPFVAWGWWR